MILYSDEQQRIAFAYEGDGFNLLPEDEEEGFVDYVMIYEFGLRGNKEPEELDGGQMLLKETYDKLDVQFIVKNTVDFISLPSSYKLLSPKTAALICGSDFVNDQISESAENIFLAAVIKNRELNAHVFDHGYIVTIDGEKHLYDDVGIEAFTQKLADMELAGNHVSSVLKLERDGSCSKIPFRSKTAFKNAIKQVSKQAGSVRR